jgi:hypothetical protein
VTPVLAQLYALRASLDVIIATAEQEAGVPTQAAIPAPGACPFCGDTEHQRDRSTLDGTKRTFCENCKREREGP